LVKKYKIKKSFIGKSPKNKMTKFSGGYGPKFTGNTILLQLTPKDRYVYIGSEIYEFNFPEEIIKYTSPVGNNDVPYPSAFSENFALFMLDKAYLPKADFPPKTDWKNAYDAFYKATTGWDPDQTGTVQQPSDSDKLLKPKQLPKLKVVRKLNDYLF